MPRRVIIAALLYLLLYCSASCLDLWTTHLALTTTGTHEGNSLVTDAQVYLTARAWAITIVGGLMMTGCVVFAGMYAERMDPCWLAHPIASFTKVCLNPWSDTALVFSSLQMLSLALGFALLRFLAAVNNLLIYFFGFAPIGGLIEQAAKHTSQLAAFVIVIVPLFYVLAIVVSPVAARIILAWRSNPLRLEKETAR